jgi:shikimate kinase
MQFFLTGFMGCGKTFWGATLAHLAARPFIDLDAYIEEQEGEQIEHLFAEKGEDYFREREAFHLRELIEKHEKLVVATGGGTPCFKNNMDVMNAAGETIYLKADVFYLYRNLIQDEKMRPLLPHQDPDKLVHQITRMLLEREPYYMRAKHHLHAESANESIFARIVSDYV